MSGRDEAPRLTKQLGAADPGDVACPCCGRMTLGERGCYEICPVCWWEDDGQDNPEADVAWGGPNSDLSLTQARVNVLVRGVFDPRREDLRPMQDPAEAYEVGRSFVLSTDRSTITEPATGWNSRGFVVDP
jgi:hypothetical protein